MNKLLKFSEEFYKRQFTAANMKSAYMLAVKWYATNVLSKDELHNVHVEFEKDKQSPTVTIHLFVVLDKEADVMEQHCKCCKEMHRSFFINEDTACNRCSTLGFQNRLEQKIQIKRDYYKELLRKRVED